MCQVSSLGETSSAAAGRLRRRRLLPDYDCDDDDDDGGQQYGGLPVRFLPLHLPGAHRHHGGLLRAQHVRRELLQVLPPQEPALLPRRGASARRPLPQLLPDLRGRALRGARRAADALRRRAGHAEGPPARRPGARGAPRDADRRLEADGRGAPSLHPAGGLARPAHARGGAPRRRPGGGPARGAARRGGPRRGRRSQGPRLPLRLPDPGRSPTEAARSRDHAGRARPRPPLRADHASLLPLPPGGGRRRGVRRGRRDQGLEEDLELLPGPRGHFEGEVPAPHVGRADGVGEARVGLPLRRRGGEEGADAGDQGEDRSLLRQRVRLRGPRALFWEFERYILKILTFIPYFKCILGAREVCVILVYCSLFFGACSGVLVISGERRF
mmetsp:Transcript_71686/g.210526  ORF Transcript_71686/g.210526 Transcript_71686/m.210526 type:complete len:385 (+) Transcript_71686:282-1436(+)